MKYIFIFFISFYQFLISPLLAGVAGNSSSCRYQPTCSEYAKQVLKKYGSIKGGILAIKRLLSCHPFAKNK